MGALLALMLVSPLQSIAAPLSDTEIKNALHALSPYGESAKREGVLRQIAKHKDARFIAPLVDLMRFARGREEQLLIAETLRHLAGPDAPAYDWAAMVEWVGRHAELKPPPGYTGWKGVLHSQIDPRLADFLSDKVKATVRIEEVQWGGVSVDGIPALVNPRMLKATEARWLKDTDAVFGVSIAGEQRAYPLRILDWHEMANDVVGGVPVALAYCTLCGSGVLFDARTAGRTFEFGSSGFLFRSNKLMYDRQTNTLWNQLTGEPVIGPLATGSIRLTRLPLVVTSWGEWRRQHPHTRVLDVKTGHERPYNAGAAYGSYFASTGTMFPVWQKSRALHDKARVFTLVIDGRAKAYALEALNRAGGVLNDSFAGRSIVVHYRDAVGRVPLPKSWGGGWANDLTLDAARVVIKANPQALRELSADMLLGMPTATRLALLEEHTHTRIDPELRNDVASRGLIGETRAYERGTHRFQRATRDTLLDARGRSWKITEAALVGPDGTSLARIPGELAYWFAWFAFFPTTELYGGAQK